MQPLLTGEPTHIGDYRLLSRLGKGAMGAVYLARSRGGRVVAIKVSRPDLAEDPEFRERFRREVAMARAVGGFWTAAVVDADPDTDQPWLATEYVPGPTLHRAVAEHGPLPGHTVRSLAAGLAEALGAVHQAGLVHRDLKPANVLLGPDGPRVIDFGISRAMSASAMTATGMFLGTPGFFSPEQTLGNEIGPPSDVFSLGAVLTFAATGSGPFGNESTAAMLYRVVHAEADLSEVPDQLRPLVDACLSKSPQARPSTSALLDNVGESSPQNDQWLPPAISATITEHTAQLQRTASAALESPPPAEPPKPGTRSYTEAQPAAAAPSPAPASAPADPARADWSAAGAPPAGKPAVERNDKIKPARPKGTTTQRSQPVGPAVNKDNPGPVFATKGRTGKILWAITTVLAAYGAYWGADFASQQGYSLDGSQLAPVTVVACLLIISGAYSLLKALLPRLKLKVNNDGLLVSRAGLTKAVPWNRVTCVGIVGRGKKQSIAVWTADENSAPESTWWHRVRSHHGGARMYPIGASGGWWTRRQEIKRVRLALQQYGTRVYDGRLL